jgi:hypothetical protein
VGLLASLNSAWTSGERLFFDGETASWLRLAGKRSSCSRKAHGPEPPSASRAPQQTPWSKAPVGRRNAIPYRNVRSRSFGGAGREFNDVRDVRQKTGERRLDEALEALASALREARGPWMVIGGIAVIARGVRRLTTDIDAVVLGDAVAPSTLLRRLARHEIRPRIDEPEKFAEKNLILLLRHFPSGVDLDVSLAWTDFEREAIASSTPAAYGRASYPMARAEDLVVFKALAARPKDIEDAAALLLMHPAMDLARVRARIEELADMAEEPALVAGFERVLAHTRAVRKSSSKRGSKTVSSKRTRKRPSRRPR